MKRKYDSVLTVLYLSYINVVVKSLDDLAADVVEKIMSINFLANFYYDSVGVACSPDIMITDSLTARKIRFYDDMETCRFELIAHEPKPKEYQEQKNVFITEAVKPEKKIVNDVVPEVNGIYTEQKKPQQLMLF